MFSTIVSKLFIWKSNIVLRRNNFVAISRRNCCSFRLVEIRLYTYAYFFWILITIKMKFGQILVCCMTNISDLFFAQCWRLETTSRLFYNFIKMTIEQDLTILNSWHLPFLSVPYSPFQKNEAPQSWHNWLLNNWSMLRKLKRSETSLSPPNCSNRMWIFFFFML